MSWFEFRFQGKVKVDSPLANLTVLNIHCFLDSFVEHHPPVALLAVHSHFRPPYPFLPVLSSEHRLLQRQNLAFYHPNSHWAVGYQSQSTNDAGTIGLFHCVLAVPTVFLSPSNVWKKGHPGRRILPKALGDVEVPALILLLQSVLLLWMEIPLARVVSECYRRHWPWQSMRSTSTVVHWNFQLLSTVIVKVFDRNRHLAIATDTIKINLQRHSFRSLLPLISRSTRYLYGMHHR